MSKQICVTNLPITINEGDIQKMFGIYGKVARIQIKETGRTRTAYVDMASDTQVNSAIKGLANAKMGANSLNVNEARPRCE